MDKKISEFKVVTATDNTTQIPLVQGLPLENCKITPRNFSSSIAEILLTRPEFDFSTYAKKEDFDNIDNTSDLDKPVSFAAQTALNKKVDKVTGKGLSTNDYTTAEKNKLSGIAAGANNYTHPASHPASMIIESITKRFVTDAEKNKLSAIPEGAKFTDTITSINGKTGVITKADIVALGIPAEGGGGNVTGLASIEYVNDRVKTTVPIGAKFTDTVTTVNGKTGEITKADIVALGIPSSDTNTITSINGKTGAILKADIVALGIPAQDTVYTHPAGTNPHGTTKADVGLGSANNTSDADKPVSTAQAAAIALKIDANKFQVVAELPTSPTAGVFYFIKE